MACPLYIFNPVGSYGSPAYAIGSGYGWRVHPVTGERKFHYGIDIPAPKGEYVRASHPGTVTLSKYSNTAGNYVVIETGAGYESIYMHLDERFVGVGDKVAAGDIIGTVGDTGRVTGAHLHFLLKNPQGAPIDPTECYNQSEHVPPFSPDFEGAKGGTWLGVPVWAWWTGAGIAAAITAAIIIDQQRDKKY